MANSLIKLLWYFEMLKPLFQSLSVLKQTVCHFINGPILFDVMQASLQVKSVSLSPTGN